MFDLEHISSKESCSRHLPDSQHTLSKSECSKEEAYDSDSEHRKALAKALKVESIVPPRTSLPIGVVFGEFIRLPTRSIKGSVLQVRSCLTSNTDSADSQIMPSHSNALLVFETRIERRSSNMFCQTGRVRGISPAANTLHPILSVQEVKAYAFDSKYSNTMPVFEGRTEWSDFRYVSLKRGMLGLSMPLPRRVIDGLVFEETQPRVPESVSKQSLSKSKG